jgi:hypothetical protein
VSETLVLSCPALREVDLNRMIDDSFVRSAEARKLAEL